MSFILIGVIALVIWLRVTKRLTNAHLTQIIAAALGLLALRLGFGGSPLGGIALAGVAGALWLSDRPRRPSDLTRARALLGVPADAGPDAIRAAFLDRAAVAHPDRGGSVADMQALNAARDLLLQGARGPAKRG